MVPLQAEVMRGHPLALVFLANITASTLKRVKQVTLGRTLGAGAFGTVHIGTCRPSFRLVG